MNRDICAEIYSARTERMLDSLFHKTDVLSAILIESGGRLDENTFQEYDTLVYETDQRMYKEKFM